MLTSAGGILALLQDNPDVKQGVSSDEDIKLKVQLTQFALRKLDIVVDEFWAEISDSIQTIEVSRELYKEIDLTVPCSFLNKQANKNQKKKMAT